MTLTLILTLTLTLILTLTLTLALTLALTLTRCEGVGSTVLLVLDGQGSIFGAFSGDAWRVDKHYYGNGESFLFTVHPQFKVYPWTRANDHFVLAAHDCLAFGSEDAGIYLDSAFEFGSSKPSITYGNPTLGSSPEFKCIKVEILPLFLALTLTLIVALTPSLTLNLTPSLTQP